MREDRDGGDTADVEHDPRLLRVSKHGMMEGRYQWCALTAARHVRAPEIGNGTDAGQRGDAIRVAELQAAAEGLRIMKQGLPVRAIGRASCRERVCQYV